EWKDPERRGFRDLKSIVATPMLDEREAAEEDPQQTRYGGQRYKRWARPVKPAGHSSRREEIDE
ncbi:MAG: hypothetical protein ACKOEO_13755, partial [Planctomycetaceae bacterium]